MRLVLTRDSVAAGDDIDAPHQRVLKVADDIDVAGLVTRIATARYLPGIAGGKATWSVLSRRPLAVIAQQWPEPRLLSPFLCALSELDLAGDELRVHLVYHAQLEPETVAEVLSALDKADI